MTKSPKLRSIRGAIDVEKNTPDAIKEATTIMIKEIIEKNDISPDDIVNIMFTMTDDLDALNPASALRDSLNIENIPLLCSQEMKIKGLMDKVIRSMVQVYTAKEKNEIKHIYLGKAKNLRPDISGIKE